MTATLAAIAPQLAKLILTLGSSQNREVIATARAIGRTLSDAGCDWRDLAETITAPPPAPPAPTTPRHEAPPWDVPWQDEVAFIDTRSDKLNDRERDFVDGMRDWLGQPSEKQLAWLDLLFKKVSRKAR
jgi:hypothetical protein